MDKFCAFCNRGDKSLMGQGELLRFEPTPDFKPSKKPLDKQKVTEDNRKKSLQVSAQASTCRRSRNLAKG